MGRHVISSPENSALHNLHYARVVGTATSGPIEFATGGSEIVLICARGRAFVLVADESYELAPYDTLYVPREMDVRVDADGEGCDLIEGGAPVTVDCPVQFIAWEEASSSAQDCTTLVGNDGQAGRIRAGVSFVSPDTWRVSPEGVEQLQVFVEVPDAPRMGFVWFEVTENSDQGV